MEYSLKLWNIVKYRQNQITQVKCNKKTPMWEYFGRYVMYDQLNDCIAKRKKHQHPW